MKHRIFTFFVCCVLLCTLLMTPVAAIDLRGVMTTEFYTDASLELPYRIYLPTGVEKAADGSFTGDGDYALLLWLHDEDLCGEDGTAHISDEEKNVLLSACIANAARAEDTIIIAPQCPMGETWESIGETLDAFLISVCDAMEQGGIYDESRVFVGGIGMGASYGYTLIGRGDTVAPISAAYLIGGTCKATAKDHAAYESTDIYAFISDGDIYPADGITALASSLSDKGTQKFTLTEFSGMGHEIWVPAFEEASLLTAFLHTNAPLTEQETTEAVTESEAVTEPSATDTEQLPEATTPSETTEDLQMSPPADINTAPIQLILIVCAIVLVIALVVFTRTGDQGKKTRKKKRR